MKSFYDPSLQKISRPGIGRFGIFRLSILCLLMTAMSFSGPVNAQDKKCVASRRPGDGLAQFTCPGTCKVNGASGVCDRRGTGWNATCKCIITASQKSCSIREFWQLNSIPMPFMPGMLSLTPNPMGEAVVWQGADPNPAAFLVSNVGSGSMMVQFGSFAIPDRVPVVITSFMRMVPSHPFYGMPTGISDYTLLPGGNNSFFYNSLTGEFSTDEEYPVYLLTSNAIRQNDIATLYLSGTLDLGSLACEMLAESYEFIETGSNKQQAATSDWTTQTTDFSIAPNPASSSATISIEAGVQVRTAGELMVYDLKGLLVHRVLVPAEVAFLNLDLSRYSQGIYQVVFKDQETFRSKRLVIQQ